MLEYFRKLVLDVRPYYVLRVDDVECNGLHCAQCRFKSKDGKYYFATTYYTEAWIAPNPLGPLTYQHPGEEATLYDVAVVEEYSSMHELTVVRGITTNDLKKSLALIASQNKSLVDGIAKEQDSDELSVSLCTVPFPMFVVTVSRGRALLGTLAVLSGPTVMVISKLSEQLEYYVQELQRQFASVNNTNRFKSGVGLQRMSLSEEVRH